MTERTDGKYWISGDSWMRLTDPRAGDYFDPSGSPAAYLSAVVRLDTAEVLAEAERILRK